MTFLIIAAEVVPAGTIGACTGRRLDGQRRLVGDTVTIVLRDPAMLVGRQLRLPDLDRRSIQGAP